MYSAGVDSDVCDPNIIEKIRSYCWQHFNAKSAEKKKVFTDADKG